MIYVDDCDDDGDDDNMLIDQYVRYTSLAYCIMRNKDMAVYFGRPIETFFVGLRPTLEAPSTCWSEWMPTGVHSSDTGMRNVMR